MIRALTIAFALVALAVSAGPASAGLLSSPLGLSGRAGGDAYVTNAHPDTVSVMRVGVGQF